METIEQLNEKVADLERELQRERNSKNDKKNNSEMLEKPNKYGKILNELFFTVTLTTFTD